MRPWGVVGGGESGGGEKVVKRRTGPRGPTETLESNMGMYLFVGVV